MAGHLRRWPSSPCSPARLVGPPGICTGHGSNAPRAFPEPNPRMRDAVRRAMRGHRRRAGTKQVAEGPSRSQDGAATVASRDAWLGSERRAMRCLSDKRAGNAKRADGPVPSGAGGSRRMAALPSLAVLPGTPRSAALPCSGAATRATAPWLRLGPIPLRPEGCRGTAASAVLALLSDGHRIGGVAPPCIRSRGAGNAARGVSQHPARDRRKITETSGEFQAEDGPGF